MLNFEKITDKSWDVRECGNLICRLKFIVNDWSACFYDYCIVEQDTMQEIIDKLEELNNALEPEIDCEANDED